jgi:hypothetical protein
MVYGASGQRKALAAASVGGGEPQPVQREGIGQEREMTKPQHALSPVLPIKGNVEIDTPLAARKAHLFVDPAHGRQHLRWKRTIRRSGRVVLTGDRHEKIADMVSIRERPAAIEDRAVSGHWEGDLLSASKNSYIATLVERHTGYVMLAKVDNEETQTVVSAIIKQAKKLPNELYKSLTWDPGKPFVAFHNHGGIPMRQPACDLNGRAGHGSKLQVILIS